MQLLSSACPSSIEILMGIETPTFTLLAAILVLVPVPCHWRTRNLPMLYLTAWLFVANMIRGINASIWLGNTRIAYLTWCDITTKVIIAGHFGVTNCGLCISIRLERMAALRNTHQPISNTLRYIISEAFMCWGFPILMMPMTHIFMTYRFGIHEDLGCTSSMVKSTVFSVLVLNILPLAISFATSVFSGMAFMHFATWHSRFARYFADVTPAMTRVDFMRLLLLAFLLMTWGTALQCFLLWYRIRSILYTGWEFVHYYSVDHILTLSKAAFPHPFQTLFYMSHWFGPISAYMVFVIFAFNRTTLEEYVLAYVWLRRIVLRRAASEPLPRLRCAPARREGAVLGLDDLPSYHELLYPTIDPVGYTARTRRPAASAPTSAHMEAPEAVLPEMPPPTYSSGLPSPGELTSS